MQPLIGCALLQFLHTNQREISGEGVSGDSGENGTLEDSRPMTLFYIHHQNGRWFDAPGVSHGLWLLH
jgi:hypothetical protein